MFTEAQRRPGIPSPIEPNIGRIEAEVNTQGDGSETVGSVGSISHKRNRIDW